MDNTFIESAIESILFVSGEPVKTARIAEVLEVETSEIDAASERIRDRLAFERRGIRLVKLDGALQLCSSPEFADYVRHAIEVRKPSQLSVSALEVLAIIAYFQPVTKSYVEQIRGVHSSYTIAQLVEKGFVEPCGKLAVPGRPVIYRTTYEFLRTFGLESLSDLPELPHVEESGNSDKENIQQAISELKARDSGEVPILTNGSIMQQTNTNDQINTNEEVN